MLSTRRMIGLLPPRGPCYTGLRRMPPLIISIGLHAVVLLTLGLFSFAGGRPTDDMILISAPTDADDGPLEEMVFESPPLKITELPEWQPKSIASASVVAADIGSVTLATPAAAGIDVITDAVGEADREMARIVALDEAFGASGAKQRQSALPSGAEFFGVKATGRRFVFVVDSSRSMKGGRFAAACRELSRAIHNLKERQFFYVILFDEHPQRMRLPPDLQPPTRAVRATPSNVRRFEQWLVGVVLEAGADPRESLGWALDLQPDAVYVLSDGEFGRSTEEYLEMHNWRDDPTLGRVPKAIIHTVGFHQPRGGATLQRIASQFGGTYRFVPAAQRR